MGYSNEFNLNIVGNAMKLVDVKVCRKEHVRDLRDKFCSICGCELTKESQETEIDEIDVITEFRRTSEDAKYLLNEDGSTCEPGTGRIITGDLAEFSKKYPLIIFQLDARWDAGFYAPPTRYFMKNGLTQTVTAKIAFEDYNENELI